jgi:mRNA interferase RelE/StbE
MGSYELRFAKSFDKDIRQIDHSLIRILLRKVLLLERNPRPPQSKKLRGTHNEYRLRVGDYRVFYTVDDHLHVVTVYHVAHRKEAYR